LLARFFLTFINLSFLFFFSSSFFVLIFLNKDSFLSKSDLKIFITGFSLAATNSTGFSLTGSNSNGVG